MKVEASSAQLITQDVVLGLCGDVQPMTIWRWRRDESLNFPKAINIRGRLYWRQAEIIDWLMSRGQEVSDAIAT
jgi:predicted DNA-binding transcriptional regulator AlpA